MSNYSSHSDFDMQKMEKSLTIARATAVSLIYSNSWQLHSTTRHFADDICMYVCANFDVHWHFADWNGMQIKLRERMQNRFGHCKASCLSDAYGKTEILEHTKLIYTVKCVTSACIVLASLICLDTFITEQQLANHLFKTYFNSASEQAQKIRQYAYFIFAILCDGCPSRVPSVQNEFSVCQNIIFGTSNQQACDVFRHEGVVAMLQIIAENRELRRRYSTSWLAKSCALLAVFMYTKNYFTNINCKKRYLAYFGECLVDCVLVCQLEKVHSEKFIVFFTENFSVESKKRDIKRQLKRVVCQRWIREFFQNWDIKQTYKTRRLDRKNFEKVTLCGKIGWGNVGYVELKPKEFPCALRPIDGQTNIGVGGYGSVCRMQFGEDCVAVKQFHSPTEYGPWINDIGDAVQEINALRYFQKTSGIIKMFITFLKYSEHVQEIKEIQMCMPVYKCDLHTWIKNQQTELHGKFIFNSLQHFSSIVVQLAKGLHHIHRAGFMHRDIKTLNILIEENEETVVWSDFGAAMFLFNGSAHEQRTRDGATYWWRAPELLIQEGKKPYVNSTASDIWSFGACIVEMAIGEVAFELDDEILQEHLLQCSFALRKYDADEFGLKALCEEFRLPIATEKNKSKLRKLVFSRLKDSKQSTAQAKEIANYIFDRIIYLLPSRRDSAHQIASFFSQFVKR